MVPSDPYDDYIQNKETDEDQEVRSLTPYSTLCLLTCDSQRSSCNNHKAVSQANSNRQNLDVTGVGLAACARHGFIVPNCVVDFQKGEK